MLAQLAAEFFAGEPMAVSARMRYVFENVYFTFHFNLIALGDRPCGPN